MNTHTNPAALVMSLAEDAAAAPDQIGSAIMHGEDSPEWQAALAQEFSFATGQNRFDKDWIPATKTWGEWLDNGHAAGRGLAFSPAKVKKDGPAIALAEMPRGERAADRVEALTAIGLDCDYGQPLGEIIAAAEKAGLACLIYTTYSHQTTEYKVKRDPMLRKLGLTDREPTIAEVRAALADKLAPEILAGAEIIHHEREGFIVLSVPPIHKARLIFPLAASVPVKDLGFKPNDRKAAWKGHVAAFAASLGITIDMASTTLERLFYTPRHAPGMKHETHIIRGGLLQFEDVKALARVAGEADDNDPFAIAGRGKGDDGVPHEWRNWAGAFGADIQIADLIEDRAPDQKKDDRASGGIFIRCPFEADHSTDSPSGTYVVNAEDGGGFVWHCSHAGCAHRNDRLVFVQEAVRQGWFRQADLIDPEYGSGYELTEEQESFRWTIYPDDDEPDDQPETLAAPVQRFKPETGEGLPSAASQRKLHHLNKDSSRDDIAAALEAVVKQNPDDAEAGRIRAWMKGRTALGATEFKNLFASVRREHKRSNSDLGEVIEGAGLIAADTHFDQSCNYGRQKMSEANAANPQIFHKICQVVEIFTDAAGELLTKELTRDRFEHFLNEAARFRRAKGDNDSVRVSAPFDVVKHLYADDPSKYPVLKGIASTPFFTASGALVNKPGYDPVSQFYYRPPEGLALPEVADSPAPEDVREALRLLVQECLGDFPIDGLARPEIEAAGNGEGAPSASLAHALALMLLPFVRQIISGPTPIHLVNKPAPGSGAGVLIDTITTIANGVPAAAMVLPVSKAETDKTLTGLLAAGRNFCFFDNVDRTIDSASIASAVTGNVYAARWLGTSNIVTVPIKTIWVFAGNNASLTPELTRRVVGIRLDAKVPNPSERVVAWRNPDLVEWVQENRPRLVWACLTLVQHWVAAGKPEFTGKALASFERWSRVMGGILETAGVQGFLENRTEFGEQIRADETGGEVQHLMNALAQKAWDAKGPIILRGGSSSLPRDEERRAKRAGRAPYVVTDLKTILEANEVAIPAWGCRDDGEYTHARLIGEGFRKALTLPWSATIAVDDPGSEDDPDKDRHITLRLEFTEEKDSQGGKPYWILTVKTPDGAG